METLLKAGETVADFGNDFKIKTNIPAKEDSLVSIEPLDAGKWLSIQEQKTVFMWCKEWAEQRGTTQDACYCEFKVKFIVPQIKNKRAYITQKQLLTDIYKAVKPEIRFQAVGPHIRSAWANHDEFHAALTQFKLWADTEAGLTLTEPDKYRVAREKAIETGLIQKVKK